MFLSVKQLSTKLSRFVPAGLIPASPSGTGVGEIEGPLEVLFAGLVGAFIGFVAGLFIGVVARFLTMNSACGSHGSMHWAAYGASAGAFALAMVELLD